MSLIIIVGIWVVAFLASYVGNIYFVIKYIRYHIFLDVLKALGCAFLMLGSTGILAFTLLAIK